MKYEDLINDACLKSEKELAIGYLRYEALRRLNPRQFKEIHERNIKGERFDLMIDELVLENSKL